MTGCRSLAGSKASCGKARISPEEAAERAAWKAHAAEQKAALAMELAEHFEAKRYALKPC